MDTQRTEKSICPIGGIIRRTGFKIGSHSCASKSNARRIAAGRDETRQPVQQKSEKVDAQHQTDQADDA